jgi:phospholipase C
MTTDRRDVLKLLGGAGVAGAAMSALPQAIAQAVAQPALQETGTIRDIKHIVILMQENRSFDHYFGTMRGVRGFGDRHVVPLESGKAVWAQSDGQKEIPPFHLNTKTTNAIAVPGTPHSFSDSQAAWNQGKFGFWPKFKNPFSMGHYRREDIPFQFALAEAFTICDAYHCSITTGTDPNRIVFWSGSNHDPELRAKGINGTEADSEPNNLRCWVKGALPAPGYTYQGSSFNWKTIPDVLEEAGVSWKFYQDPNNNWTGAMHGCLAFESFRTAKPGSPIYEKGMRNWSLEQFAQDVKDGTLPAVSWILPPKDWSEHPGASTPLQGAEFTARILEALSANPEVWGRSAFFLTFDENDGLFDHFPPAAPPTLGADGKMIGGSTLDLAGFYCNDVDGKLLDKRDTASGPVRPWGLGTRVPMYVVSPYSRGGWVNSEVMDHTSIGQFIEARFGVTVPAISPWHRAVCGDLTSAFDFVTPNDGKFPELPDASGSKDNVLLQIHRRHIAPPETAQPLFQEAGTRPSRALPYVLDVRGEVTAGEAKLVFRNTGKAGAVFHVHDRLHLDRVPRRYTVEAGKSLSDVWALGETGGRYDLMVMGPNGFLRTFVGSPAVAASAVAEINAGRSMAVVRVSNAGASRGFEVVDLYAGTKPVSRRIGKGSSARFEFDTRKLGGWYDVTVSADGFERRFAGRIETGKASVSDPAMAAHLAKG